MVLGPSNALLLSFSKEKDDNNVLNVNTSRLQNAAVGDFLLLQAVCFSFRSTALSAIFIQSPHFSHLLFAVNAFHPLRKFCYFLGINRINYQHNCLKMLKCMSFLCIFPYKSFNKMIAYYFICFFIFFFSFSYYIKSS
eukprot:GHVU01211810.1.p2 GENE.GHVU01211810.1~~GHVU01211810.1.p2  ORF type:complete len:138 (+),score=7.40 GHVU01211810.1:821-1234(+)